MNDPLYKKFRNISYGIIGEKPYRISEGLFKIQRRLPDRVFGQHARLIYSKRQQKVFFRGDDITVTIYLKDWFMDICNPTQAEVTMLELENPKGAESLIKMLDPIIVKC